MPLTGRARKRNRSTPATEGKRSRQLTENELESRTAWAVGLNPSALTDEEATLLPPGSNESAYIKVRNHVLTKWRGNVSAWLSEDEAAVKIMPKFRHFVTAAWKFLTLHGYINFGVAPAIMAKCLKTEPRKGRIIVVGAGLAGLGAARQLRALGHDVVVVEARDRLGGRVYTKRMQNGGVDAVADLGGSVISGIDGNPLAVLAKQLNIPMHRINEDTPFYCSDGKTVDMQMDTEAENTYNSMLDKCGSMREQLGDAADNIALGIALEQLWDESEEKQPQKRQLLDWHLANLEFANASKLDMLSMRGWDQDDPYEFQGQHVFLPGCNLRLVAALADGLPVFLNNKVSKVQYSKEGACVHTASHYFEGDAVLLTVPLGILKYEQIDFDPPLSNRKKGAISRLGFGVLNKVVLLFPEVFWDEEHDMFGHVNEHSIDRGRFFLFYSYAHISGGALLTALVAGDAAVRFEEKDKGQTVDEVMKILRNIFEPNGVTVPPPLEAVCTRWGKDPFCFGSYSSVSTGSPGSEDYDKMAESEGGRLFFAGEATTCKYPATMHGAYISGLREAANISSTLERIQNTKAWEARGAAQKNTSTLSLEQKLATGQVLMKLFSTRVDEEFGCFSAILPSPEGSYKGRAVVQIQTGKLRPNALQPLQPVFVNLSLEQLQQLKTLEGDHLRLIALTKEMGISLVGNRCISDSLYGMSREIAASRGLQLA